MRIHSRYEAARRALLFWTLFIGIGAVGGAQLHADRPAAAGLWAWTRCCPIFRCCRSRTRLFQNFTFPGFALLIVNGLTNLTAAGLLFARKRAAGRARLRVRRNADALDLHPVLYLPAQFHVDVPFFIFGLCAGGDGLRGVRVSKAGSFPRPAGRTIRTSWNEPRSGWSCISPGWAYCKKLAL